MALGTFFGSAVLAAVLIGAFSVYALGRFEPAYGAAGSLSVIVLFGVLAAGLCTATFGVSSVLLRRCASVPRSAVLGASCVLAATLLAQLIATHSDSGVMPLPWTAAVFLLCAVLASFASTRVPVSHPEHRST